MKTIMSCLLMLACAGATARGELNPGDEAPEVTLPLTGGETAKLSDYRGQWVVLYFYPKADTPGCTKQACSLRDGYAQIRERNAVVLGVSVDDLDRQERFKEKYELPFALVADKEKEVARAFDVLGLGGLIAKRVTYLIDPQGRIAEVMEKVDVGNHEDEVLAALKRLQEDPAS